jgi:TPR repeat protein
MIIAPKHVNQGHAEAANNLGGMYEYGYGVPVGMML